MEYFEVNSMEELIALIVVAILFGLLGRYINHKKGRSKYNGFWICFFLGIIGAIVLALRPKAK